MKKNFRWMPFIRATCRLQNCFEKEGKLWVFLSMLKCFTEKTVWHFGFMLKVLYWLRFNNGLSLNKENVQIWCVLLFYTVQDSFLWHSSMKMNAIVFNVRFHSMVLSVLTDFLVWQPVSWSIVFLIKIKIFIRKWYSLWDWKYIVMVIRLRQ